MDPVGKDDLVRNISLRVDSLDGSYSALMDNYDKLSEEVSHIDERVRIALIERLDPTNGTGFRPVEGERQFGQFDKSTLLENDAEKIELRVTDIGTRGANRVKCAKPQLYSNGRLMSDQAFQNVVLTCRTSSDHSSLENGLRCSGMAAG